MKQQEMAWLPPCLRCTRCQVYTCGKVELTYPNGKKTQSGIQRNYKTIKQKVCKFITAQNTGFVNNAVQSLLSSINTTEIRLQHTCLKVDKEIQFNEWLFSKLWVKCQQKVDML